MSAPDLYTRFNKAELDFIKEKTRTLLVMWADHCILYGRMPLTTRTPKDKAIEATYLAYALDQGWVTKDGKRVSAKGFKIAASFLRR